MNWKQFTTQLTFSAFLGFSSCEAAQSIGTKIGLDFSQSTAFSFGFTILMIWLYLLNNKFIRKNTINEIFGELHEK